MHAKHRKSRLTFNNSNLGARHHVNAHASPLGHFSRLILTVTDNHTSFVVYESMLVQLTRFNALQPGIVGGQTVVLGTLSSMPEWDHTPKHRLDYVWAGFRDYTDLDKKISDVN
jgi:hypothetical protein